MKDQAAQYKSVADDHRAMAEAYKNNIAMPLTKRGIKRWRNTAGALAKDADKLAADAEQAADFHSMRAKELQEKYEDADSLRRLDGPSARARWESGNVRVPRTPDDGVPGGHEGMGCAAR